MLVQLVCPSCQNKIVQEATGWRCPLCDRFFRSDRGVLSFLDSGQSFNEGEFHGKQEQAWTRSAQLRHRIRQSRLLSFLNRLRIKFSLSGRRDRIFFNEMRYGDPKKLILDIGCGGGRHYFCDYGQVVGIDPVMELLQISKKVYSEVYQASATAMPFADGSFDYVVSSDVIGHIPFEIKDVLFAEMYRVLKRGGRAVHVIETDGTSCWARFAHKYPDLFERYLVDVPGHISLELPSQLRARFAKHGFKEIKFAKICGNVQECGSIAGMFDNEFITKSRLLAFLVTLDRLLSRNLAVKEGINFLLEPAAKIDDWVSPFDSALGALVVFEK